LYLIAKKILLAAVAAAAVSGCSLDYGAALADDLAEDIPDTVVFDFAHTVVENGSPRFRLEADRGESFQAKKMMKLTGIRFTEYAADGAAAGKPLVLTSEADGAAVSVERRAYDESGRLSTVETTARGRTTLVENAYDEQGALYSTRTSSGGAMISLVRYESPGVRVEELYDAGQAFARVRYEDGRRVLEEILKDGVVVRSRRFD